jgi:SNF2 family DNA or RNA helicase
MPAHQDIEIEKEDSNFLLIGDVDALLANQRLYFSLKRLGFQRIPEGLAIPFQPQTEMNTLQELQAVLEKFGFGNALSIGMQKDKENFIREQENFQEFSDKARLIRNDEFEGNPELVAAFDSFQSVVGQKLTRKLYPLQLLSAFHMAFAQNACNFAVPGAGKTSIVYAAYAYLKNLPTDDPKHVDKLVVIGPLSSFAPWEKEYRECFGKEPDSKRLSGDHKMSRGEKEEHLFSGNPAEITLIFHGGVEALQKEIVSFLKANKTMVVVDEAHRIKNPEGVWGKSIVDIGREARARIILTGTPVPNGYEDLFNLFQYLYPFRYKDILHFHYGNLVEMTKTADLDSPRVKELTENISPYFIRIKKSDLKLPPVKDKAIEVPMGERQREIYDYVETKYMRSFLRDSSASLKDILNRAKLIRLRQAATNPALLLQSIQATLEDEDYDSRTRSNGMIPEEFQDDSGILNKIMDYAKLEIPQKFIAAKELISDLLVRGEKVIVWTIFIQNAKGLQSYLAGQGIRAELLIGEVEQVDRESLIDAFNDPESKSPQVVIANPFSVAESISLHKGCHNAIYLERDYNCSNFLQSKDRIHRVGLPPNQETNYFYLLSKESIDGVINDRLEMKARRMEKIIDSDIPLFARINDSDETDLIKALMEDYAKRV